MAVAQSDGPHGAQLAHCPFAARTTAAVALLFGLGPHRHAPQSQMVPLQTQHSRPQELARVPRQPRQCVTRSAVEFSVVWKPWYANPLDSSFCLWTSTVWSFPI